MTHAIAVFGGGCFWCTEAVFKMLRGVYSVAPGYAGGNTENPTYYKVSEGDTGHAEVIKIEYDPAQVSYRNLLTVFFGSHDATQLNRQGNDVGTQYRSVVLYADETQKQEVEAFIQELNNSTPEGRPIVTEVAPLVRFYDAEKEHLDYYARNREQGYCQLIIEPKLEKVQKQFAELLKTHSQ
jgi:peptide-methionine (S)-S-oxide reductase